MTKTALVVGRTGVVGQAIARTLIDNGGWRVIGVSRSGDATDREEALALDLLDSQACRGSLEILSGVSHIFFAAFQPQPTREQEIAPNRDMLANILTLVEDSGADLQRVVLVTGAKRYGIQWGAARTPMRESDPRDLGPNFYFAQEDLLRDRAGRWSWCNLVPPFVTGFSQRAPMNIVMAIGVFATLCGELGLPLAFPGSDRAFHALHQFADADMIARASIWAAESSNARNQVFNVANGDASRWSRTWDVVADYFHMERAPPKTLPLAQVMPAYATAWRRIVRQHGLVETEIDTLVNWSWADYMLRMEHDVLLETGKIRRAGFADSFDSEVKLLARLEELKARRIIPGHR